MPLQPKDLTPLQQVVLGVAVSLAGLALAIACGTGTQSIPLLVQCQLDALRVLPADPNMATKADAIDVAQRILSCRRTFHTPDAGPP